MTKFSLNIQTLTVSPPKGRSENQAWQIFYKVTSAVKNDETLWKKQRYIWADACFPFFTSACCIAECGEWLLHHMSENRGRTQTSWTRSHAPPQRSWAHPGTHNAPSDTTARDDCNSLKKKKCLLCLLLVNNYTWMVKWLHQKWYTDLRAVPDLVRTLSRPAVEPGDVCRCCHHLV